MTLSATGFTDGIVVFCKPQGMTSHDAVSFVRKLTGVRRVGHAGTLDPMAEGVLPICVGAATRLIEFMNAGSPAAKAYDCEMRLGVETDTLDIWGKVVTAADRADERGAATPERVRNALESLTGDVEQIPPAYSAIKYKGRKLYEYARAGEEIPSEALRPRKVYIESVDVKGVALDDEDGRDIPGFATVRFSVVCSGGVYVRSIVRDVGATLGFGAAMSALTRTKSGMFTLADSHTKEDLERAARDGRLHEVVLPPDAAVSFMPSEELSEDARWRFANGAPVRAFGGPGRGELTATPQYVRVYGGGVFLGVGRCADDIIKPCKVIRT